MTLATRLGLAALLLLAACTPPPREVPELLSPTAMAVLPDGTVAVADGVRATVLRLAPDGTRTLLTGAGRGSGPDLREPEAMAPAGERLWLVDAGSRLLLEVDPATGDRREMARIPGRPVAVAAHHLGAAVLDEEGRRLFLWRDGELREVSGPRQGSGPIWRQPAGLCRLPDGSYMVADAREGALFRVESDSGARRLVSGQGAGSGPALREPEALILASESVWVADIDEDRLVSVALRDGSRFELSGPARGEGPPLEEPHDLAFRGDDLLVLDMVAGGLVQVNPFTGDRRLWAPLKR